MIKTNDSKNNEVKKRKSTASYKSILEYWVNNMDELGISIDIGEPTCWACGDGFNGKYDTSSDSYWKYWEKSPLQRCHILADSLNGSNQASNLVLLCRECHDLSPNTMFKSILIEWMQSQSYMKRFFRKMENSLEDFGIDKNNLEEILILLKNEKFIIWSNKHSTTHLSQNHYSGTGNKLTVAAIIGLYKYIKDNNINFN